MDFNSWNMNKFSVPSLVAVPEPIGLWIPFVLSLLAVFRKKPEGWMFIHYAEAPLAPLTYVEHLYRKDVMPNFEEIAKPMDPVE